MVDHTAISPEHHGTPDPEPEGPGTTGGDRAAKPTTRPAATETPAARTPRNGDHHGGNGSGNHKGAERPRRPGRARNNGHHTEPIGTFPAIGDYAFLSDCESTCLVAPSGAIEWMCVPHPDSASIFAALLDRGAGSFRLGPFGIQVPVARRYLPGTLVLETTWQTPTGWLIVSDALAMGPWHHVAERSAAHRRAPTDTDAEHYILRTVRCIYGTVDVAMDCEPVFDYGRADPRWAYPGAGYSSLVATAVAAPALTVTSSMRLGIEGRAATARTRMSEGDEHFVVLAFGEVAPPTTMDDARRVMDETGEFWRSWLTQGAFPDHPWRSYLQTSALALKGLSYAPTGALLAAPTTSLPETPQGERNWDYRYTWIRDSTFALWGLYTLGFDREANDFFYFIHDVAADDGLQVMYAVDGRRELTESTLDHLSGYDGARPVRVGNGAYDQKQHDVWGALLDSIYLHARSREQLPEELWPIVVQQVEQAAAHWHEPDRGIWEIRGEPQHFTASKIFCWVAMDRGARLAQMHGSDEEAKRWADTAAEIHADVLAHGVDARGVLVQSYGSQALDASLLMAPLVRFLAPDDERIRATVLAIAKELTHNGLVLRYKTDTTDDGLSGAEGSFTICSFWLVSALVEIGELRRARALCERLLSHASPLGLYSEELDSVSGRHLGNFPQAFTHLAQINAINHVIRAEAGHESFGFAPANRQH